MRENKERSCKLTNEKITRTATGVGDRVNGTMCLVMKQLTDRILSPTIAAFSFMILHAESKRNQPLEIMEPQNS